MHLGTLSRAFLLAFAVVLPLEAQINQRPLTVTSSGGPIFVIPDEHRTPLTVVKDGTPLRVIGIDGDWYNVEFADDRFGDRAGYIQTKNLKLEPPAGLDRRIPVFVRNGVQQVTRPNSERQNSASDLVKKLKDSKSVRQVDSENEASVILEIMDTSHLAVRMIAGDYSAVLPSESASKNAIGDGDLPGQIVKQLETWAKANPDRLTAPKR